MIKFLKQTLNVFLNIINLIQYHVILQQLITSQIQTNLFLLKLSYNLTKINNMQGNSINKLRSTSIRTKSSKIQSKQPSLQIIPSQVVFKDIEINQFYQITIQIRNLTHKAKRIRIQQCSNPNFSVLYTMQPEIAPGLSMTAKVKYLCKELKNQTEFVKVLCDQGNVTELPVRVYRTESQIIFEPFINLGFVKCGKQHKEMFILKNIGKAPGKIQFSHNHGPLLSIEPNVLTIAQKQQAKVSIKFKTSQPGLFKGEIHLKSEAILVKDKIDLHATAVEFARYIVDSKGGQTSTFDFKNLYAGQQSVIKGFLINNSPKKMSFKAVLRKGYLISSEQFALTQTPVEIGLQQSQKIMFMEPQSGTIQPFGQKEIFFTCKTKITYKDKVYTKTFALTSPQQQGAINSKKNSSDFKPQNMHQYSALISIEQDQPIVIQLKALTSCPQIKIQRELFQFGDCYLKDTKQQTFIIQNKSNQSKAEISFNKIPNFSVFPNAITLRPLEKAQIRIQFQPKTIGKFDVIQKLLINKIYQLDLRLFGIATHEPKSIKKINDMTGSSDSKKFQPINTRVKAFSVAQKSFMSEIRKSTVEAQKSKLELSNLVQNRQKFNQFIKQRRSDRLNKKKQQNVQKRWSLYQTKLKDLGPGRLQQRYDQEGNPINPPIDYEFQSGMNDTKLTRQQIALPQVTEHLFVNKHINDYEPLVDTNKRQKFNRAQTESPKQILPDVPVSYNHRRQITAQLSPDELSLIEVMNNQIDFGDVYIKSKQTRYFWVRNSTKKAISVEVNFTANQLKNSYKKPQILKSGEDAGFEVVFCKDTLGQSKGQGKYIINGIYEFQMSITAKSTPVQIQISSNQLKFHFDESSLQFSTQKQITLKNPGNSSAFFKFLLAKDKMFVPKTLQGTLQSKQSIKIPITLNVPNPTVKKNEYIYTQRLVLKVLDGQQNPILCTYSNPQPKYTVKCQKFLSKPVICLGHDFEDSLDLKNGSKNSLVIHVQSTNNLQITPNKFKLNGDQSKKLNLKFAAKIIGQFNISITIIPRGGQKKVIESVIKVIEPTLKFSSQHINMGTLIVNGVTGVGKFTLKNSSQIPLPLIIDIRPKTLAPENPYNIQNINLKLIDCPDQALQIISPQKNKFNEIVSAEGENLVGQNVDQQEFENSDSQQEQIVEKNQDEYRKFKLNVLPEKQYSFQIQFYPNSTGDYDIQIPMSIERSIKVQNSPSILAQAIKPEFIFQPSIVDFKRKIVTKPQRCYPKFMSVTIHNIDNDQVSWQLDDSQIKKQGIFQISQTKGKVKSQQKLQLKISFNPYQVGSYNYKLPLFIQSSKIINPLKYVDVILKGTASLPNIYFNKRQVIMPVVPLGMETFSSFKIINDGYENCNLKCQFIDDVAGINVKVHFPEGANIGITRQKLKIDLTWKFAKPMSFCLKLEFVDDMNRTFIIPVSGTTDNCIFTNYTFFLRNQGKFKVKAEGSLQLIQSNQNASSSLSLQRKNSAHSLKSNATNKSIMSYLGVSPINQTVLTNTLNYILRYLNANLLTTPIHQFPESLIENDGSQLFEIISFVSNKSVAFPCKYNGGSKGPQKTKKLFDQYNELIKLLKIQGALLNHIRPQYLLSFNDLNIYLSTLPEQKSKYLMPSLLKINRSLYNYLSIQSWITLLYQIFKIYVLTRVNPKNFKAHILNAPQIPKHCFQQSNFSSLHENILFYWVQQAVHEVLLEDRRLTNFDKDFKDGIAIGALMKKYANNQVLKKMKIICTTKQDFQSNATILCDSLKQIGLLNHIVPRDIYSPLQRQMLLFILNLYVYLPFYVPKQDPIVFKCILGQQIIRSIQLTNPSNKPVIYQAKYQGSEDFKLLGQRKIRLQPKETYKFQVKFVSRISAQVCGRIMFVNVKQNSITAAPLVFDLKSQITGKINDRIWNISGVIYEQVEFNIDISNKFLTAQVVDFQISYQTEYIFQNAIRNIKNKNERIPVLPEEEQIQTIYGKVDNIKIRKNGIATLTLNYIPISLYTTRTIIYFCNNIIGEFQHQIIGTVEPPSVTAQIRPPMSLTVDQTFNWQYVINPKNDMISRAKKAIQGMKKRKGTKQQKDMKKISNNQNYTNEQYIVQIAPNPYVNAKQTIWVNQRALLNDKAKDSKHETKNQSRNETNQQDFSTNRNTNNPIKKELVDIQNKIPFTIICKNPVYEFSNYVLVYNKTKTDVRRYRITFTIQPKPLKAILEMNVPARGEITQNLPIVNNTDRDWNIKITWQPDMSKNGHYFIIPSQYTNAFAVKKQSIGNFPITFKPKWTNKAQAKLIMSNPLTLDNFEYEIIGNGQDPLAQDHIEIKCQAKQRIKKEIIVKNPYSQRPINLRVEVDLLNCQAPSKLTIPSAGKQKFQFYVQPMLCGQYTGSITFYEQQGPQYLWYTVSVVTNFPQPYKTLDFSTQIRSKVVQKLYLPYKQSKQNTFQVIINGNGLSGPQQVTLRPKQDNFYCLQYLPLQIGQQKGSVIFINNQVGQILFQFNLTCTQKPPVIINDIKSPLGVSSIIKLQLQNPISKKITLNIFNTNEEQFVFKVPVLKLQPYEKKIFEVEYIPASLDKIESGVITFKSKQVGDWVFELSGTGLAPIPYEPKIVYNGVFEEHSESVKFRNPFKYEIMVGIKLIPKTNKDNNIFKLLSMNKTKFNIDSFGILQIPFSFIPPACSRYYCDILVMISQKIFWTFPIIGVTQVNKGQIIASLTSVCRQATSSFAQVDLQGVQNFKQNNQYSLTLQNIPSVYERYVQRSFSTYFRKQKLNHANDSLEVEFSFKPMKPIKVSFDLLVTRKEGSRWRYKVNLQGVQPEPDDIIEIESNLLVTSTVTFKLTNWQKTTANFKARFTSDSAHQFSVQPKQGTLAKYGSKGTSFFVSFTPVQYGKQKRGKLIIQTTDMYWSYILKGSLPKYVPPKTQVKRSRIVSSIK